MLFEIVALTTPDPSYILAVSSHLTRISTPP